MKDQENKSPRKTAVFCGLLISIVAVAYPKTLQPRYLPGWGDPKSSNCAPQEMCNVLHESGNEQPGGVTCCSEGKVGAAFNCQNWELIKAQCAAGAYKAQYWKPVGSEQVSSHCLTNCDYY